MSDNKVSVLNSFAKIIGLIAVVSGIYGVSYQKGMIMAMNLGNLSGNYDVKEIFNTATLGYFDFYAKVATTDLVDIMFANWFIVLPFSVAGLLVPFLYKRRDNLESYANNVKKNTKIFFTRMLSSYFWSPIVGSIIGVFLNAIAATISYSLLMLSAIFLLPSIMGYVMGGNKIDHVMANPACEEATEEMFEQPFLRQCTHIKTRNNNIKGEILLSNKEGYFVHMNDSFLYLKKDKVVCMSSKFKSTEGMKHTDDFKFIANDSDKFCKNI